MRLFGREIAINSKCQTRGGVCKKKKVLRNCRNLPMMMLFCIIGVADASFSMPLID